MSKRLHINTHLGLAVLVDETRGFVPQLVAGFGAQRTTKLDGLEVTEYAEYQNANFVQDAADILRFHLGTHSVAFN